MRFKEWKASEMHAILGFHAAMVKKLELEMNAAWLGVGDDVANILVPVRGWNQD